MNKLPVAVVGATGLAGQQFLAALAEHPRFELVAVAASERSAGKSYAEAIAGPGGESRWHASEPLPASVVDMQVVDARSLRTEGLSLVFSALETAAARELEPHWAAEVPVISTASAFRYEADVPILLPGVNPSHLALLAHQRKARGTRGFIAPNPNCTTVGLAITLAPLHARFGVSRVVMTSLQSVSGAGRTPGVPTLDMLDNVVPYIAGEEDKVARETVKILGTLEGDQIRPAPFPVSATCTRVPVLDGHTETVSVELARPASRVEVLSAWDSLGSDLGDLPSKPPRMIRVTDDPYRPQPRLDRDNDGGMATTVGRLRQDDAFENGWKYVLVSHNTRMGAARGCLFMAEILDAQELL